MLSNFTVSNNPRLSGSSDKQIDIRVSIEAHRQVSNNLRQTFAVSFIKKLFRSVVRTNLRADKKKPLAICNRIITRKF